MRKPEIERTNLESDTVKSLVLKEELVYKQQVVDNSLIDLYYVPKVMRKSIAIRYHDLYSHLGADKTINRIKNFYYFPYMRRYIKCKLETVLNVFWRNERQEERKGLYIVTMLVPFLLHLVIIIMF